MRLLIVVALVVLSICAYAYAKCEIDGFCLADCIRGGTAASMCRSMCTQCTE